MKELMEEYLLKTKGLLVKYGNESFIWYKVKGDSLEIWDVYSRSGGVMDLTKELISEFPLIKRIEGYVDNNYENRERSNELMVKFGFKEFKKTEEYTYYELIIGE